jgi:hypothetical protein
MSHHLVGVREIAALLRVRRQRADQLSRTKGFPEPLIELASGRIWTKEDVVKWAGERRTVSEVVRDELRALPKGRHADALSIYRMVYAVVRQKGLGSNPEEVEPTPEYAHKEALKEARKVDPNFALPSPLRLGLTD